MRTRQAPGVRADHLFRQVVDTQTPEDAHSAGSFYASLIPHGDRAIDDALDIIRAAHEFRVCPAADACPIPLPEDDES